MGLSLPDSEADSLRSLAGKVSHMIQKDYLSDVEARNIQLLSIENFDTLLKQSAPAMEKAVKRYQGYLYASAMGPMNVGPALAEAILERALDSRVNVDLFSYIFARMDLLRYAGTDVADAVDRVGRIYGNKTNLYRTMVMYSAITTMLSPGIVNSLVGRKFCHYVQGFFAWPDLNVWLSRWGVSGSVSTRLRFDTFEFLASYEGLIHPFYDVRSTNYTNKEVFLDAMQEFFARGGSESSGSEEFIHYVEKNTTVQESWNYAYIFGRAMEEYVAKARKVVQHKVFEVMLGGTLVLSDKVSFKAQAFLNSEKKVPTGISGSVSINAPGKASFVFGIDSLSPMSMAGSRMFVNDPKVAEHQRQTAYWMELAVVC